ncbi:MAG: response regulator [Gemmatimonadetes bacterium]|nr:response regulator [Gemmatimonadota bacterium]
MDNQDRSPARAFSMAEVPRQSTFLHNGDPLRASDAGSAHAVGPLFSVVGGRAIRPLVRGDSAGAEPNSDAERMARLLQPLRRASAQADAAPAPLLLAGTLAATASLRPVLEAAGRHILLAHSAAVAEAAIADELPALVLVDLRAFEEEGEQLLTALHARRSASALPVVALGVEQGRLSTAEWFARGVDSLLAASETPDTIAAAVAVLLRKSEHTARRIRCDALTQIPDATGFCESFEWAASLAAREREPLSMAFVDLDGFRAVADRLGYGAADDVLRRVSALFVRCFRNSDLVARWQGDTFAVLFPSTARSGAISAVEKVLHVLRRERFAVSGHSDLHLTGSAGVAQLHVHSSMEETLSRAAVSLIAAKRNGGDCYHSEDDAAVPEANRRILLADDDELTSSIIRHRLERAGFDVLYYRDGASALAAAPSSSVSLAILNVKMPEMDGFEVLRRLRSVRSFRGVPIVMLTSLGGEKDIVRGFRLGADDYVVKPFSPNELVARVQRLLERV